MTSEVNLKKVREMNELEILENELEILENELEILENELKISENELKMNLEFSNEIKINFGMREKIELNKKFYDRLRKIENVISSKKNKMSLLERQISSLKKNK